MLSRVIDSSIFLWILLQVLSTAAAFPEASGTQHCDDFPFTNEWHDFSFYANFSMDWRPLGGDSPADMGFQTFLVGLPDYANSLVNFDLWKSCPTVEGERSYTMRAHLTEPTGDEQSIKFHCLYTHQPNFYP